MGAKLDAGILIAERPLGIRVQQHAAFALADMTVPHGLAVGRDEERTIADQAGVEAVLQVYEGMSHAAYNRDPFAPENKEVFEEIARFFDKHLGK